jgi:hypothetical protein
MAEPDAVARFPRPAVLRGLPFQSGDSSWPPGRTESLFWDSAMLERKIPTGIPWMHPTKTLGGSVVHPMLTAAVTAEGRHLLARLLSKTV